MAALSSNQSTQAVVKNIQARCHTKLAALNHKWSRFEDHDYVFTTVVLFIGILSCLTMLALVFFQK